MIRTRCMQYGCAGRSWAKRPGAVLVAALVGMLIACLIVLSLVRLTILRYRQAQYHELQMQADWLATSAIQRAEARLRKDSTYTGETWELDAQQFDGEHSGVVRIRVLEREGQPRRREIVVESLYPLQATVFASTQETISIQLDEKPKEET